MSVEALMPEADFNLPKGFELIAQDAELGPKILEALSEVEQRLERAVAQTNHLADVASRHLLSAGGKRVRPCLPCWQQRPVAASTTGSSTQLLSLS